MTERWVKQVEKIAIWDSKRLNAPNVYAKDVLKLLARQHQDFVGMVKKEATESVLRIRDAEQRRDDRNALIAEGHRQMCAGILAVLAKQGGGKK